MVSDNQMSLKQQAYDFIESALLAGRFLPGHRISPVDLAKEMGVSRMPVREAISQLEQEGVVEQIPRLGVFVRKLDRDELEELWDLRIMLEGYAAKRAASRITAEDLKHLENCISLMREYAETLQAGNDDKALQRKSYVADLMFHSIVWKASKATRVEKIMRGFHILSRLYNRKYKIFSRSQFSIEAGSLLYHYRIYRALRKGDGDAARYFDERHLTAAKEGLLGGMKAYEARGEDYSEAWPNGFNRLLRQIEDNDESQINDFESDLTTKL